MKSKEIKVGDFFIFRNSEFRSGFGHIVKIMDVIPGISGSIFNKSKISYSSWRTDFGSYMWRNSESAFLKDCRSLREEEIKIYKLARIK